jgi:spore photoproduct lyase
MVDNFPPNPSNQARLSATDPAVWCLVENAAFFVAMASADRQCLSQLCQYRRFSYQQLRQICEWAADFRCWGEPPLADFVGNANTGPGLFEHLRQHWLGLCNSQKSYTDADSLQLDVSVGRERQFLFRSKAGLGLGRCPVASLKTRCCNLRTLDVVEGCGFDCSYCAIKTFYEPGALVVDPDFGAKLRALSLPQDQDFHIGTGQSSDSLLCLEQADNLAALLDFARRHPRVILEFKTKSAAIEALLDHQLPPNLLCTWSLNTPVIIAKEELRTASLEARLAAARTLADRGTLVGFHVHPMVQYQGWQADYTALCQCLLAQFRPAELATISLGTLTFTKPVLKRLRQSLVKSKILQMPLVEAAGKFSYPLASKQELFSCVYQALAPWHGQVFFYLCMEDPDLWIHVFNYQYDSNEALERAMIQAYKAKIAAIMEAPNGRA